MASLPLSYDLNEARMESVFIGISGLIGAGKSTLATALAKKLGLPVYFEPVKDNEYLSDFYSDMKRHSFAMQIYLLNERFKQQQQIVWSGKGGVQDRTIYEDSVFARMLKDAGLMDERDYRTYISLFNHMSNFMKKPNIIVHLDVPPEESLRRIRMRERECENGITLEYLQGLHRAYEEFISDISRVIPVIKVNYATFRDVEEMATRITDEYSRIHNIRHVEWGVAAGSTPVAGSVGGAGSAGGARRGGSPTTLMGSMSPTLKRGASAEGAGEGDAEAEAEAGAGGGRAAAGHVDPVTGKLVPAGDASASASVSVSASVGVVTPPRAGATKDEGERPYSFASPGDKKAAPDDVVATVE